MANHGALAILHFFALVSCIFGIYYVTLHCSQVLSILYTGLWFITSGLSDLAGLLSVLFFYFDSDSHLAWSNYALQYHYLLAWISCIVGYTSFVTSTWIHYYPCILAHGFIASAVIPLIAWIQRQGHLIIVTTQTVVVVAVCGHVYISYLAQNMYCLAGAVMMLLILLCISLPTSYTVLDISARELCIVSVAVTSYLLAKGLEHMTLHPGHVKSLVFCLYGLYYVYINCTQALSVLYTGTWFFITGLSNLLGILSILFYYSEADLPNLARSNFCLQYYYLFAWLSCIVGYPAFVSSTWIHYAPTIFAHGFILASIVPIFAWIQRLDRLITFATQSVVITVACAHIYISYINGNMYCLWGAINILLTLLFFSLPTSRTILGMSTIEASIVSSAVTSYFLANGVEEMGLNPIFFENYVKIESR